MGATNEALQVATSQKQSFGAMEVSSGQDVASSSAAAHARAMVESRYVMAMRNPRNMDQVRQDLISECRRPSFANNPSAFYKKPIGSGVEGLGIRFVEVALRCLKNVVVETKMIFENESIEVHNVAVTDLESNITYPMDVKVTKSVERSKPDSDGSYLSVRMNSYNKPVYTIAASDDDLLNKRAALISKAIRTLGLRIIPGDLQDEAEQIIKQIRRDQDAADPEAARKKIVDSFSEYGVKAKDLVEYLGHDIGQCTPAQLSDLRALYGALKEGETTWKSVMANKADQEKPEDQPAEEKPKTKSATAKAKDKIEDPKPEAKAEPATKGDPEPAATQGQPDPDFVQDMENADRAGSNQNFNLE
jgi:ferritin-like protein